MPTYRYHWTYAANLPSIAESGLDPAYAKGAMRVVWTCEESRIMWAVGHVARHHEVNPDMMVLLKVRVDGLEAKRTSWPCVLVFRDVIPAGRIVGVRTILSDGWVSIKKYKTPKRGG